MPNWMKVRTQLNGFYTPDSSSDSVKNPAVVFKPKFFNVISVSDGSALWHRMTDNSKNKGIGADQSGHAYCSVYPAPVQSIAHSEVTM
jgi:hypothetical protein